MVLLIGFGTASAFAQVPIYSDLSAGSSLSLGFDADSVHEFGGVVIPDFTSNGNATNANFLTNATVQMVNYAFEESYADFDNGNGGYNVPLTLSLYNVDSGTGLVGSLIQSSTTTASINWAAQGPDTQNVNFAFSTTLPSEFVYLLSFDTTSTTTDPQLGDGPYNELNMGLTGTSYAISNPPTTVGTNPAFDPGNSVFYDSAYIYSDDPDWTGTPGSLAEDFGWISTGYGSGVVEFDATTSATPEPATFGLIGFGLIALGVVSRKKGRR